MRSNRKHAAVKFLSVVGLLSASLSVFAQDDFEAYRRQQTQGVQQIKNDFHEYKEQQDKDFAGFLKSQWSEFATIPGDVRIKEPEPKQAPVVQPAPGKAPVVVAPITAPVPPPAPQAKPVPVSANELELSFYGNVVRFGFDPQWQSYRLVGEAKPEAFSDFWTMMSGSNYAPTIQTINAAQRELKLDDWGRVTLWRDVVRALQPGRKSEQNLLLWFLLIKSGYDVRLGYYGSDVHLFVAMKQQVYSTKYVKILNQKYYAVLDEQHGNGIRAFYSYQNNYPAKLNALDIQSAATGFTKAVPTQRTLSFEYKGQEIKFTTTYDRRLVEYMGTFPQTEFELYFDTDGSPLLRGALLSELKKYTATMSEEEAVNFLLAFVQKAFAYKTDADQFGYEKYFFVEENMYFPYNDCKKRSVLFAWLVRELVGIKVVGLLYPNHMTTAVELKQRNENYASILHEGKRYVIADPTYIGASVGMPMPSYAKYQPTRVVDIQ